jgi:hypothetical protein
MNEIFLFRSLKSNMLRNGFKIFENKNKLVLSTTFSTSPKIHAEMGRFE